MLVHSITILHASVSCIGPAAVQCNESESKKFRRLFLEWMKCFSKHAI